MPGATGVVHLGILPPAVLFWQMVRSLQLEESSNGLSQDQGQAELEGPSLEVVPLS